MAIVTLHVLKLALLNTLGKRGMPPEEIDNLAGYIMNFFGFNEYVIDNKLSPRDRDVFYMLEEEGILKTTRDEVTIQKGKVWRIHYWILDSEKVYELARPDEPDAGSGSGDSTYEDLPEALWERHNE